MRDKRRCCCSGYEPPPQVANEQKYPYIVELLVVDDELDVQVSRRLTDFHRSRKVIAGTRTTESSAKRAMPNNHFAPRPFYWMQGGMSQFLLFGHPVHRRYHRQADGNG